MTLPVGLIALVALPLAASTPSPSPSTSQIAAAQIVNVPRTFTTSTPGLGNAPCGPDVTSQLNSFISHQATGTTLNFPHDACYTISSPLDVTNKQNLTFDGNGSAFNLGTLGAESAHDPILYITLSSGITFKNFNLDGPYTGTDGSTNYEGAAGIWMEGDANTTFNGVNVENVQGDCLVLQGPYDISAYPGLNTNITFIHGSLANCGYHGISVESVNGFTFSDNTVTNVGVDAMDFEVDSASSVITSGVVSYVAEDNVTIANNTWTNWGADWFASLQGQTPGVQEQHLTFSNNTLNSTANPAIYNGLSSGLFDVNSTCLCNTSVPYTALDWKLTGFLGNAVIQNAYAGVSPFQFAYVDYLTVANNTLTINGGASPSNYAIELNGTNSATIKNNAFYSAVGILVPSAANDASELTECGNDYGAGGTTQDSPCASDPGTGTPEAPFALTLPIAALGLLGGFVAIRRRRERRA
jgi:Right handed beta helix region